MARVFIVAKANGYYVRTYRGIVAGPFLTYDEAKQATPSQIHYKRQRKNSLY